MVVSIPVTRMVFVPPSLIVQYTIIRPGKQCTIRIKSGLSGRKWPGPCRIPAPAPAGQPAAGGLDGLRPPVPALPEPACGRPVPSAGPPKARLPDNTAPEQKASRARGAPGGRNSVLRGPAKGIFAGSLRFWCRSRSIRQKAANFLTRPAYSSSSTSAVRFTWPSFLGAAAAAVRPISLSALAITLAAISSASSGFCRRYSLALSRPWPSLISP